MTEVNADSLSPKWLSSYGIITAERILHTYKLDIPKTALPDLIKSTGSFYFKVIQIPMKNVLNGIVLQQANDYHNYVQKLFIDFLLSAENAKDEQAQGTGARENLDSERQLVLQLSETLQDIDNSHNQLISKSQKQLIDLSAQFNAILDQTFNNLLNRLHSAQINIAKDALKQAFNDFFIRRNLNDLSMNNLAVIFLDAIAVSSQINIDNSLMPQILPIMGKLCETIQISTEKMFILLDQVNEMNSKANSIREQFYESIIRVLDFLKLLPDYHMDLNQDASNRENLHFDKKIGEFLQQ